MIRWNIVRAGNIMLGRHKPLKRVADPAGLYQELVNRGLVEIAGAKASLS